MHVQLSTYKNGKQSSFTISDFLFHYQDVRFLVFQLYRHCHHKFELFTWNKPNISCQNPVEFVILRRCCSAGRECVEWERWSSELSFWWSLIMVLLSMPRHPRSRIYSTSIEGRWPKDVLSLEHTVILFSDIWNYADLTLKLSHLASWPKVSSRLLFMFGAHLMKYAANFGESLISRTRSRAGLCVPPRPRSHA